MTHTERQQQLQGLIDRQIVAVAEQICAGHDAINEYSLLQQLTHHLSEKECDSGLCIDRQHSA
jgi:fructosamine-3-kinase